MCRWKRAWRPQRNLPPKHELSHPDFFNQTIRADWLSVIASWFKFERGRERQLEKCGISRGSKLNTSSLDSQASSFYLCRHDMEEWENKPHCSYWAERLITAFGGREREVRMRKRRRKWKKRRGREGDDNYKTKQTTDWFQWKGRGDFKLLPNPNLGIGWSRADSQCLMQ